MEPQKPQIAIKILGQGEAKIISLPDLRLYCKSIVIKTVWYRHKNRHMDQWINGTEQRIQKINKDIYDPLTYNNKKRGKNIQQAKGRLFKSNVGKTEQHHVNKRNQNIFSQHFKNKLKDLGMRPETVKLPKFILGSMIFNTES